MGTSRYIEELRKKIGHDLLMLPGVAALVRDGTGLLLLERRADDGRWSLPAGAIDPGERPADAIVREVWEETGLTVVPMRVAGVFGGIAFRHTYPNRDEVEPTTIVFDCAISGGELREQDGETSALRFFSPEETASLLTRYPRELFISPGVREALFAPPGASAS